MVSIVASQQQGRGFNSRVSVLPVPVWVLSGHSGFLPKLQNMQTEAWMDFISAPSRGRSLTNTSPHRTSLPRIHCKIKDTTFSPEIISMPLIVFCNVLIAHEKKQHSAINKVYAIFVVNSEKRKYFKLGYNCRSCRDIFCQLKCACQVLSLQCHC